MGVAEWIPRGWLLPIPVLLPVVLIVGLLLWPLIVSPLGLLVGLLIFLWVWTARERNSGEEGFP